MSEEIKSIDYRDVRTLLFCKDVPSPHNYSSLFEKISNVGKRSANKSNRAFLAFGGYDALCVYSPEIDPRGTQWFREVYEDKQAAIRKPPQDVLYHQMHLVSQNEATRDFWEDDDTHYPFFLVTLVYGVNTEKYDGKDLCTSEQECSLYEKVIRKSLAELRYMDKAAVKYAIYNGITVSDVVILWKARDLTDVMHLIAHVEYSGIARKTLSTLCFPVDKDGVIEEYVSNYLKSHPEKSINVSLRGAVRDIQEFLNIRDQLPNVIPREKWTQSLGKNDLGVSADITYEDLLMLLELYQTMSKNFYNACWEFLTDIRTEHIDPDENERGASRLPKPILCALYEYYQKLYEDDQERGETNQKTGFTIMDYSWFNALQELLSTHHYIDHHPVLHGPSYLVCRSLLIAYSYFSGQVKDYDTPEKLQKLLRRSEENIITFIRSLDQLTEQITRNDDAMLNNHSNSRTIHFSLSESALEFYHAFLRRIVDYVLEYDRKAHLLPDDFEYDFLLSPVTCSRFRSSPVFKTDHQDHGNLSDRVWPNKQAYVLELPLESVFKPIDIFIPFVHECFHCFGDRLRQRKLRKQRMAMFIASSLLNRAGMGKNDDQDLCALVARIIYPGENHAGGDYLRATNRQLEKRTSRLLDTESVDALLEELDSPVSLSLRYRLDILRTELLRINSTGAVTKESGQVKAIVEDCNHLFKECYADAMAISLLGLKPKEYLGSFLGELRRSYDSRRLGEDKQETAFNIRRRLALSAQRFGIVLATCSVVAQKGHIKALNGFEEDVCIAEIDDCKQNGSVFDSVENTNLFVDYLKQSFIALTNQSMHIPSTSDLHSPAAMRHVMEYLKTSIERLYQEAPALMIPQSDWDGDPDQENPNRKAYYIDDLQEDFKHIIRNCNMFGKKFYDMIHVYHREVCDRMVPKEGSAE